jgi:hypothetical protein
MRGRYLRVAGDKAPYAGDDGGQYRPHESAANDNITHDAGGAGGIFPGFVIVVDVKLAFVIPTR